MKKHYLLIISFFIAGFFYGSLKAQSNENAIQMRKFGIGIHIEPYRFINLMDNYYSTYTTNVLLPINVSQHFRIEPEVGFLFLNEKDQNMKGISSGLGSFYMFQRGKVNFYSGLRMKYNRGTIEGVYFLKDESLTGEILDLSLTQSIGFEEKSGREFNN